jgi:ribose 5-phosphate isomerase A
VIPYAWKATRNSIKALLIDLGYGDEVPLVLRERDGEIVVTDSGNYIIDAHLDELRNKVLLDTNLNWIAGVVENGLFSGIAHEVIFANPGGEVEIVARVAQDVLAVPLRAYSHEA